MSLFKYIVGVYYSPIDIEYLVKSSFTIIECIPGRTPLLRTYPLSKAATIKITNTRLSSSGPHHTETSRTTSSGPQGQSHKNIVSRTTLQAPMNPTKPTQKPFQHLTVVPLNLEVKRSEKLQSEIVPCMQRHD